MLARAFSALMLLHVAMVSGQACANTCSFANDGECDDGRTGAPYFTCPLGTDCADCGNAVGLATHCTCDNVDNFLMGGVIGDSAGAPVACDNAFAGCSFASKSCSTSTVNGVVTEFTHACSSAPSSGNTAASGQVPDMEMCMYMDLTLGGPVEDCSGNMDAGVCNKADKAVFDICTPGDGFTADQAAMKMKCSGTSIEWAFHAKADCSDSVSKTCVFVDPDPFNPDPTKLVTTGCSMTYTIGECGTFVSSLGMGVHLKFTGTCPGEDEAPCFSREAEACRVLDTSVAPSAAFRACLRRPHSNYLSDRDARIIGKIKGPLAICNSAVDFTTNMFTLPTVLYRHSSPFPTTSPRPTYPSKYSVSRSSACSSSR